MPPPKWCQWLNRLYVWLGGREELVIGRFINQNGVLWGKSFGMVLVVSARDDPEAYEYALEASASSVRRFSSLGWTLKHPEYEIGTPGASESRKHIYAHFTPFADPAFVVNVLSDINLECLTRWTPCINEGDVMPHTRKSIQSERGKGYPSDLIQTCQFPLEILGRDNGNVAIAEVVSSRSVDNADAERRQLTTFRLKKMLKGEASPQSGEIVTTEINAERIWGDAGEKVRMFRPGESWIVAFDRNAGPELTLPIDVTECGVIPLNQQNLLAIQRGIQMDGLPDDEPRWPYWSILGFAIDLRAPSIPRFPAEWVGCQ